MATANVVRAWQDTLTNTANIAVSVAEGGNQGTKEYIGSVSMTDDLAALGFAGQTWTQLSAANKKAVLIAAVKVTRDAQQPSQSVIPGVSGAVTI